MTRVALMRLHLGGELALCPRSLASVLAEHPGVGRVWVRTVRWVRGGVPLEIRSITAGLPAGEVA